MATPKPDDVFDRDAEWGDLDEFVRSPLRAPARVLGGRSDRGARTFVWVTAGAPERVWAYFPWRRLVLKLASVSSSPRPRREPPS